MKNSSLTSKYPKKSQAYAALAVLFMANIMSFVDRQIPAMLVGPIKQDFGISDSEVALLIGFTFAATYALVVLPIGLAVDRLKRNLVLGSGIFLWSIMTVGAVFATTYNKLLGARMGVAAGEAVIAPVSISLVGDSFPENQRGRAMGIITAGVYIGIGISLVGGGYLIDYLTARGELNIPLIGHIKPWQAAFVIAGAPGIIVAVAGFLLRDPPRLNTTDNAPKALLWSALQQHIKAHNKTLFFLFSGFLFMSMIFYSFSTWAPTMLVRTHGLSLSEIGIKLGILTISASILGTLAAGFVADKFTAQGYKDAPVRAAMLACVVALPAIVLAPLMTSITLCWSFLALYLFAISSYATLGLLAVGSVAHSGIKGQITAFFALLMMISGMLGPQITAAFTDFVFKDESMLNASMAITGGATLPLALLFFWLSLPHFAKTAAEISASS